MPPPPSNGDVMADESAREPVGSPCISICNMNPLSGSPTDRLAGGLCVGCLRTLDEIVEWGSASETRKRAILKSVDARRLQGATAAGSAPAR